MSKRKNEDLQRSVDNIKKFKIGIFKYIHNFNNHIDLIREYKKLRNRNQSNNPSNTNYEFTPVQMEYELPAIERYKNVSIIWNLASL